MKAIFIDGAGHQKEADADGQPIITFVRPHHRRWAIGQIRFESVAEPRHDDVSDFQRLGTLSDQRLVYGQVEANLEMWKWKWVMDNQSVKAKVAAQDAFDYWVNTNTMQPFVTLFLDEQQGDDGCVHVCIEGVARMRHPNG